MLEFLLAYDSKNSEAASAAETAAARASLASDETARLRSKIESLELALETLVRLGIRNNWFTEEEFVKLAREVDAEDGVLDGRRDTSKLRRKCPLCKHLNPEVRQSCMWCNADLQSVVPAFHAV